MSKYRMLVVMYLALIVGLIVFDSMNGDRQWLPYLCASGALVAIVALPNWNRLG